MVRSMRPAITEAASVEGERRRACRVETAALDHVHQLADELPVADRVLERPTRPSRRPPRSGC